MSLIFQCGSILEGLLLAVANMYPRQFNTANSSIKDSNGKVISFHSWKLADLINTAGEIGIIREDVVKHSHSLRDFRNYIHPFQQLMSGFYPDLHTGKISLQVLNATFAQVLEFQESNKVGL